jgi:2'-5' RNA ligase
VAKLQFYRYFLGIKVDPRSLPFFRQLGETLGLPIRLDMLHLTLCVVAQTAQRNRFVLRRIGNALRGQQLHSFAINLSRVRVGPHGVFARSFGRQDEIQDFFRALVRLLRIHGMEPLHRTSGLHPHVTLTHRASEPALLEIALRWFPAELLLIESEVGLSKHNVLGSWRLLPPRQPPLPFDHAAPELRRVS